MIRFAEPRDAPLLAQLYNYYVVNTVTTLEEEPVFSGHFPAMPVTDRSEP